MRCSSTYKTVLGNFSSTKHIYIMIPPLLLYVQHCTLRNSSSTMRIYIMIPPLLLNVQNCTLTFFRGTMHLDVQSCTVKGKHALLLYVQNCTCNFFFFGFSPNASARNEATERTKTTLLLYVQCCTLKIFSGTCADTVAPPRTKRQNRRHSLQIGK